MRTTGVKDRIERAAIELFAAHGVDGVSISDIAAAAGVAQGALYRHYRSKDELAARLFADAYLRTGEELAVVRDAKIGLDARIAAMIEHFCALYDRDAALFRFMLIAQHDLLPRVARAGPTPVEAIESALAGGVATGEIGDLIRRRGLPQLWASCCKPRCFISMAGWRGHSCRARPRLPGPHSRRSGRSGQPRSAPRAPKPLKFCNPPAVAQGGEKC